VDRRRSKVIHLVSCTISSLFSAFVQHVLIITCCLSCRLVVVLICWPSELLAFDWVYITNMRSHLIHVYSHMCVTIVGLLCWTWDHAAHTHLYDCHITSYTLRSIFIIIYYYILINIAWLTVNIQTLVLLNHFCVLVI